MQIKNILKGGMFRGKTMAIYIQVSLILHRLYLFLEFELALTGLKCNSF